MDIFEEMLNACKRNSQIAAEVIDNFLISYAADKAKLDKEFDQKVKKYKQQFTGFPKSTFNYLKTEYIAGKIFEKEGLVGKFLKHSAIKDLLPKEIAFLEFQHQHPWRYSFAEIIENPKTDFYLMYDILTGEEYMLYSQSMTTLLGEKSRTLWFNLVAFNGRCYQTFGMVKGFASITPDDLTFYATEVNPTLLNDAEIQANIHHEPIPYFLLILGMEYPAIIARDKQIFYLRSLDENQKPDYTLVKQHFDVTDDDHFEKWQFKECGEFPDFAAAYFVKQHGILFRFAQTEEGFEAMTDCLNSIGFAFDVDADVRITPALHAIITQLDPVQGVFNPFDIYYAAKQDNEI